MSTEAPQSNQGPSQYDLEKALRDKLVPELVKQQDILYAIIGGLSAAIITATAWAALTVITHYQIGYVAIGVGVVVGICVRYFGAGVDVIYSVIAGACSLLGCALGDVLSQLAFAAQEQGVSYLDMLAYLDFNIIIEIFREGFSIMSIVFYAIAVSAAFRVARRDVEDELAKSIAEGKVSPPPYQALRLPVAIVAFVLMSIGVYFMVTTTSGDPVVKTYAYESGKTRAMGSLMQGREDGSWGMWWENGNKQAEGNFLNGRPDSVWTYFHEDGARSRTTQFSDGLEEGMMTEYYPDGSIQTQGFYHHGRQTGPWIFKFQNGDTAAIGAFKLDQRDGEWKTYFENGQMSSKGTYTIGVMTGRWTEWFEDGQKSWEIEYDEEGTGKILNSWDAPGKPTVVKGEGSVKIYNENGVLRESGTIKGGFREGKWEKFFNDGKKYEVGEYKDKRYYVMSAWNDQGESLVYNGNGPAQTFYADGSLYEVGKVSGGLRNELWEMYYPGGETKMVETNYVNGDQDGMQTSYSEEGVVTMQGAYVKNKRNGEWKWYSDNGELESVVTFVDEKKEGPQLFYNSYGDLMKTEVYKNGVLVESTRPGN